MRSAVEEQNGQVLSGIPGEVSHREPVSGRCRNSGRIVDDLSTEPARTRSGQLALDRTEFQKRDREPVLIQPNRGNLPGGQAATAPAPEEYRPGFGR